MRFWDILNEQAVQRLSEGGNAFDGVGTIHIDEVQPTLDYISKKTDVKDVHGRALGSTGKKEYSGDMDIAVEPKSKEETAAFIDSLKAAFGEANVRKIGDLVTTKVPIQKYNPENDGRQPRTGFVQVDYIFGNPEWLKLYYHSPSSSESTLKGTHRNLAITAVASRTDRQSSEEVDSLGRPVEVIRWKWSPKDGLFKIVRKSKKNARTGEWIKGQSDEMISEPVHDANQIAKILFKGKAGADALNSAESVIAATKKAYDETTQEKIFKTIAHNYKSQPGYEKFTYPLEIAQYMDTQDETTV